MAEKVYIFPYIKGVSCWTWLRKVPIWKISVSQRCLASRICKQKLASVISNCLPWALRFPVTDTIAHAPGNNNQRRREKRKAEPRVKKSASVANNNNKEEEDDDDDVGIISWSRVGRMSDAVSRHHCYDWRHCSPGSDACCVSRSQPRNQ